MSVAEFGEALMADDVTEVIMIRPDEELKFSSLEDEAVLKDTKKALNARSGFAILEGTSDMSYPLLLEYRNVLIKNLPVGFRTVEWVMRLNWFL